MAYKDLMHSIFGEEVTDVISESDFVRMLPSLVGNRGKTNRGGVAWTPENCSALLIMRFGLGGNDEKTLAECGEVFGVNRERVRQVIAKEISRLRLRKYVEKYAPNWYNER